MAEYHVNSFIVTICVVILLLIIIFVSNKKLQRFKQDYSKPKVAKVNILINSVIFLILTVGVAVMTTN